MEERLRRAVSIVSESSVGGFVIHPQNFLPTTFRGSFLAPIVALSFCLFFFYLNLDQKKKKKELFFLIQNTGII